MSLARRLYRIQTRLAITGAEATALFVLTGALALGLGVRQYQSRLAPPSAALVEADAAFAALDAAADSAAAATEPVWETRIVPADSVVIPTTGFADAPPPAAPSPRRARSASAANSPVRMNLNTADAALLQRLPRIGPALAGRIIAYRQERGPFGRVEEVENVRGIGPKTLEKIAPWLYVE